MSKGNFALKRYPVNQFNQLTQIELFVSALYKAGLPVVPAQSTEEVGGVLCQKFPWIEGQVKPVHQVSISAASLVTQCVAAIHGYAFDGVLPVQWQWSLDLPVWQFCQVEYVELSSLIRAALPMMQACEAVYQKHRPVSPLVCAHRDLHLGNIIWQSDSQFQIIDWERAGMIEAAEDLLYWLLDSCVEHDQLNLEKLAALSAVYAKHAQSDWQVDEGVLAAVLMNWLAWLQDLIQRLPDDAVIMQLRYSLVLFIQLWQQRKVICRAVYSAFL